MIGERVCPLTPRQCEVLAATAAAGSRKLAAERLGISLDTVKNTLGIVNRKLGTYAAITSAVIAVERGWDSHRDHRPGNAVDGA